MTDSLGASVLRARHGAGIIAPRGVSVPLTAYPISNDQACSSGKRSGKTPCSPVSTPNGIVRVAGVEPVGIDAVTVYFKGADGKLAEQMLFRADEVRMSLAEAVRAWAFDGPLYFATASRSIRLSL